MFNIVFRKKEAQKTYTEVLGQGISKGILLLPRLTESFLDYQYSLYNYKNKSRSFGM